MYAQQRFSEWSANGAIVFYYGIYVDKPLIFISFLVLNGFYYGYLTSALLSFTRASASFPHIRKLP